MLTEAIFSDLKRAVSLLTCAMRHLLSGFATIIRHARLHTIISMLSQELHKASSLRRARHGTTTSPEDEQQEKC